ncbi:MAG: hypothetical protein DME34_02585 [Verrucomicrobia bacterium]|nr:MAG: hypothetical protein DME34_02585 [Verrucomicrobiota bacterium]
MNNSQLFQLRAQSCLGCNAKQMKAYLSRKALSPQPMKLLALLLVQIMWYGAAVAQTPTDIATYCDGEDVAKLYSVNVTYAGLISGTAYDVVIGCDPVIESQCGQSYAYRFTASGEDGTAVATPVTNFPSVYHASTTLNGLSVVTAPDLKVLGSSSIVYVGFLPYCPHGWTELVVPMTVKVTTPPYTKPWDRKNGGDQKCHGMAHYSAHSMLASLNIEDTPVGYTPPRGTVVEFTVTYNQRDNQQPQTFTFSNLGPKWTFNWLSYVVDDPNISSARASVYVAGGGAEIYSGFDSGSQSYLADPQSHALLMRTSSTSYERRLPDGAKQIFALADGALYYPRKIFMTQVVDPAGNAVTIGYDGSFRIKTLSDGLNPPTTISYENDDPLKITKVTDPFGRFATFSYPDGKLTTITDPVGIQSQFHYASGSNFIDSLTTPYGTTTFATGQTGTNKWIEITDPLTGKERVEFRDNAPGIGDSETVAPAGMTNSGLAVANTFYWDKKSIEMFTPQNGFRNCHE